MKLEEALRQAGVDLEKTLHRFSGNAALLERFVKKFPLDPTYNELLSAAQRRDHSTMEKREPPRTWALTP